jgi:hypothetical protein
MVQIARCALPCKANGLFQDEIGSRPDRPNGIMPRAPQYGRSSLVDHFYSGEIA